MLLGSRLGAGGRSSVTGTQQVPEIAGGGTAAPAGSSQAAGARQPLRPARSQPTGTHAVGTATRRGAPEAQARLTRDGPPYTYFT